MKADDKEIIEFLDAIINADKYIKNAQEVIKENYNVESIYKKKENSLYIYTRNINESLNVLNAKEYLLERFPEEMLTIKYGIPE